MNRKDRRAALAAKRKAPLKPARADGRPLYYDISAADKVVCYFCETRGIKGVRYGVNEAFIADPANSPDGSGDVHTVCRRHIPDNAVIYNAPSNKCRNKAGDSEWMEDNPDMDPNAKIAARSGVKPQS